MSFAGACWEELRWKASIENRIGDFQSPLYTKTGSGETGFRYPKDAAQGGWVGVSKPTHMSRVLMKIAWQFSILCALRRAGI